MSEAGRRWAAPQLGGAAAATEDEAPVTVPGVNLANSLALARSKAAAIVARAEEQARQVLENARQEGLAEGYEAGRHALEAEQARLRTEWEEASRRSLEALAEVAQTSQTQLWDTVHDGVMNLVVDLCERLLGERLVSCPELLLTSLTKALEELAGPAEITLQLHPEQIALAEKLTAARLKVVADASLSPGDFLASGAQGTVDGRLSVRLRQLEKHLLTQAS